MDHADQLVGGGEDGLLEAFPRPEGAEVAVELAVFGSGGGVRALGEDPLERRIALPGASAPPPLSLLLGQTPAHAAQCACEAKTPMSGPSSARMAPAAEAPIPGMVCSSRSDCASSRFLASSLWRVRSQSAITRRPGMRVQLKGQNALQIGLLARDMGRETGQNVARRQDRRGCAACCQRAKLSETRKSRPSCRRKRLGN